MSPLDGVDEAPAVAADLKHVEFPCTGCGEAVEFLASAEVVRNWAADGGPGGAFYCRDCWKYLDYEAPG